MALDGSEVHALAQATWGNETIGLVVTVNPTFGEGTRQFAVAELFTEVAWLESSWDPTENGRFGELGLWQIHPVHFEALRAAGIINSPFDLHDPRVNARAAKFVYEDAGGARDRAGLEPWTTADEAMANVVAGTTQLGTGPDVRERPQLGQPSPAIPIAEDIRGAIGGAVGGLDAVGAFFAQLLDREMWLRIGIGVGGVLLVVLAVVLANRDAIAQAVPAARAAG